jgi:hypothetical protein
MWISRMEDGRTIPKGPTTMDIIDKIEDKPFVTICMYCKRVKLATHVYGPPLENPNDYWISHGICDKCEAIHFPQEEP